MANILDWAKREVEIACKRENPNRKEGKFDYGCACYASALKAFESLCEDGSVTYDCNDHCYCIDINGPNNTYSLGLVRRIIHEMYPIKMPYMPGKPIKVYCEDFLFDPKNGDFDTVGVLYALKEDNGEPKRIEINRFFRGPFNGEEESKEYPGWVEIDNEEYETRRNNKCCKK